MEDRNKYIINKTEDYVRQALSKDTSGHGWWHIVRVRNISSMIHGKEGGDKLIIELASLLHDVIDYKVQASLENKDSFDRFLKSLEIKNEDKDHVMFIIDNMSFSKCLERKDKSSQNLNFSKEFQIVSDADKIDALGALGIARTFAYGSKVCSPIYDPSIRPEENLTVQGYKNRDRKTSSFNHFYEKLLKIKDLLYTDTGKEIARQRDDFMKKYIDQFLYEWNFKE